MSMEYPCIYFEKNGRCRKFSDDTAVSYCVMGPCPEQTLSNADHIRAMSDEELAEYFADMANEDIYDGPGAWLVWLQKPTERG